MDVEPSSKYPFIHEQDALVKTLKASFEHVRQTFADEQVKQLYEQAYNIKIFDLNIQMRTHSQSNHYYMSITHHSNF